MKIHAAIIDAEQLDRVLLRQMLRDEPDVEVVGECENIHDAIILIREKSPRLLFLDVQMPEMSGFDLLRALPVQGRPAAIFVAAHERYAREAFDVHAVDYLLKPLKRSRLHEAVERVRAQLRLLLAGIASSSPSPAGSAHASHIPVKSGGRTVVIPVENLDYIEGAANYAVLHVGAESHVLRQPLMHLAARLPNGRFLRVSRSAIVNLTFISEMRRVGRRERGLVLKNGKQIAVTRGVSEIHRRLKRIQL
jgi:two-component system, LytTR family, response regulator